MQNNMKNFFKFLQPTAVISAKSLRPSSWYRITHEAVVDWVFIVLLAITSILILIVLGVSLYMDVDNTLTHKFVSNTPSQKVLINETELSAIVDKVSNINVSNGAVPADPSL